MAKHNPIQISIPEPCSQSWDEMTVSEQGRFCTHCSKTVIDFTEWSDAALYGFFAKNKDHVCGRFLATQTDRTINIPYQPYSRLYRIAVALGLTLLFTQTPDVLAQNRPPKVEQSSLLQQATPANDSTGEIKGRIIDDKAEPLPSAVVQVYQGGILKGGAATDFDGAYSVQPLDPGSYDLFVLYAGFDSIKQQHIVVAPNEAVVQNFNMKRAPWQSMTFRIHAGRPIIQLADTDEPEHRILTPEEVMQACGTIVDTAQSIKCDEPQPRLDIKTEHSPVKK